MHVSKRLVRGVVVRGHLYCRVFSERYIHIRNPRMYPECPLMVTGGTPFQPKYENHATDRTDGNFFGVQNCLFW